MSSDSTDSLSSPLLEADPNLRSTKKWLIPVGAVLAVYVVIRVFANYTSWHATEETPGQDTVSNSTAKDAGVTYALLISDPTQTDQKDVQIQTLWRLIQVNQWRLPNDVIIGDAPALAKELQKRAITYYQARNGPQAASFTKILLRWSVLVLNSTGGSKTRIQPKLGVMLAQIALDTMEACPLVMNSAEIQRYMDELRIALENEAGSHFSRMLGTYLRPQDFDGSKSEEKIAGWKLFANRDILEDFLQSYMSGGFGDRKSARLTGAHLKTWLLVCPLTWNLFAQSIQALEEQTKVDASLLEQLKALQGVADSQGAQTPSQLPSGTSQTPGMLQQQAEPVLPR